MLVLATKICVVRFVLNHDCFRAPLGRQRAVTMGGSPKGMDLMLDEKPAMVATLHESWKRFHPEISISFGSPTGHVAPTRVATSGS